MMTYSMTAKNTQATHNVVKNLSKKTLISAALISSLTISPVFANDYESATKLKTQQEDAAQLKEEIGLGTGMVIGAIFGGPIGAFVTGVAGNLIAKNMNAEDEVESISTAYLLEKQSNTMALARYKEEIAASEQRYQAELLALEQNYQTASLLQAQNLLMSLQFSTGSSEIKAHYQDQIISLARIVKQSPHLVLDLSGYTDKQGSEALNQALSLARINAVKNALIDQGVMAEQINLFAYGEQQPVVASVDKEISFYDRRVVIKLKNTAVATNKTKSENAQTAQNY
ncbi:sortase-associated OmpA-like protein PdsO [Colwellia sp. M166]|uniref:sortase-associated OmpA-like protein PdsO n=1 Tax=Colwellia sp. M166 TaxID=2583805 RepID=UPI00211E0F00|nr:sortase-associated OmpA-like protein PdsO [Colwellia sp. M166]UUO22139.1 sortase-associated OmpA-like protein PdsO [Colwellia sp. M166]|tara:strand:+ start:37089 stop:37943 length:855 start_codon:yes stop_codon:yes gene_type:complete